MRDLEAEEIDNSPAAINGDLRRKRKAKDYIDKY
jgi:hypothetical protein